MEFVRTDKSIYYFWNMFFCRFVNLKNAVLKQFGYFSYIYSFWEYFPSSTAVYIGERNCFTATVCANKLFVFLAVGKYSVK